MLHNKGKGGARIGQNMKAYYAGNGKKKNSENARLIGGVRGGIQGERRKTIPLFLLRCRS